MKRLIVATISGLAFGFVCYSLAASGTNNLSDPVSLEIIISRTLMGFAIGISSLKLSHWSVHGIVMGLIFSLPLAISGMLAPESSQFTKEMVLVSTTMMGIIY